MFQHEGALDICVVAAGVHLVRPSLYTWRGLKGWRNRALLDQVMPISSSTSNSTSLGLAQACTRIFPVSKTLARSSYM